MSGLVTPSLSPAASLRRGFGPVSCSSSLSSTHPAARRAQAQVSLSSASASFKPVGYFLKFRFVSCVDFLAPPLHFAVNEAVGLGALPVAPSDQWYLPLHTEGK